MKKSTVFKRTLHASIWFMTGAFLGLFFFVSFLSIIFQKQYENRVYPGVIIEGKDFGSAGKEEIRSYFAKKNDTIKNASFTFTFEDKIASISAEQLHVGFDEELLADQAISIGRSENVFSNLSLIVQAYTSGVVLSSSYRYSENDLMRLLKPLIDEVTITPIDALFTFQDGKVIAFRPSENGRAVDFDELKQTLQTKTHILTINQKPQNFRIPLTTKVVEPAITTEKVNNLGIRELVGAGTSHFKGSIPNRIYNITLAASRLNGVLIPPNNVFSFNTALGDVSAFTGYKQAYIIQNGRTVLGDGGGVCQVSSTLFRAAINAGFPIIERNQHAYRVSYYEQDSGPGFDAAVYAPRVDLKFKNDTAHHLLIQSYINDQQQLTFEIYGSRDNRDVTVSKPVILSQSPPPEPLYQDDPELPKGTVKQVDFAAAGARVYFTREVKKDGKVILSDKFVSNYQPWKAVFLRGTKE